MKKQYLLTVLFVVLVFGVSQVSAGTLAQIKSNTDLRATYEARKSALEAQREKMRAEATAAKAAAEARGDEMEAKRAELRLSIEARRAEADARMEVMRKEAETRRAKMQAAATSSAEFRADTAKSKVDNTARVTLSTVERLNSIITRLESRIAKIKAQGGVTVESEEFVADAKVNLSNARTVVSGFANIDLSSAQARENYAKIRAAAAEAREHIRLAHQNMMLAVRALSSAEMKAGAEASVQ
jgi:hypothetical protein